MKIQITPEILEQLEKYGHHGTEYSWEDLFPEILRLARIGLEKDAEPPVIQSQDERTQR